MDLNLSEESDRKCIYCSTYSQIHANYPVNTGDYTYQDDGVHRCELHWKYECSHCSVSRHFNGITWCHECKLFTCIQCGKSEFEEQNFFVYDYYYLIQCASCKTSIPALDYLELDMRHPFQMGDKRPLSNLQIWMPFGMNENDLRSKTDVQAKWGQSRFNQLETSLEAEYLEEDEDISTEQIWNDVSKQWGPQWGEEGDVNHKHIIIPAMLDLMHVDTEVKLKILDVGCGTGNFTRKIRKLGHYVTGVDVSDMLNYAIKHEDDQPIGIQYQKVSAFDLRENLDKESFDMVVMNMAIMDIPDLVSILQNIKFVLKTKGKFVFSLTHPIFSFPTGRSLKFPKDSERNEDRVWIVDNYFEEGGIKYRYPGISYPMLNYHRMISTYINSLIENNFIIQKILEPKPNDEIIRKYPREMLHDYDRTPKFMIISCTKQ